ncbi:class I SAM-dependent methyltransferase [Acinetobacter larvae]|uniref:SAM-dependent methyltransferase n=1 Tax=Acinetobacter larvae TaxID=1789224 RepID=A0A1B2M2F0_9GAMM|nr:class I SAM-dependent methyltransferase [Acinetobacter larvae]AOA59349.1 SAM-dependent methyltransferase [Acinetobacter larvae]
MSETIHHAAQAGFSSHAQQYQLARPHYPEQIVAWLKQHIALDRHSTVVDVGSGTGKFLPYLQQSQAKVIAVEPIAEMLQQLQQAHPDITAYQADSQHLPFADATVDLISCAQSFHWFDNIATLQEFHRILKPQGHLLLVWNQRDISVPWVQALAEQIAQYEADTPRYHSENWKKVFQQQDFFQALGSSHFALYHEGRVQDVVSQRLLSTSFIAAMPQAQQQQLKQQFESIVQHYTQQGPEDQIAFPYTTYLYHFQKTES